jgi:hypothetical protein
MPPLDCTATGYDKRDRQIRFAQQIITHQQEQPDIHLGGSDRINCVLARLVSMQWCYIIDAYDCSHLGSKLAVFC